MPGRTIMVDRSATSAAAIAFAAALTMAVGGMAGAGGGENPKWKGQGVPVYPAGARSLAFDPGKPEGLGQQAPLTPEYQKILEESVADQANGGFGNDPTAQCYPAGMPRMMAYEAQEYVITPDATYILLGGD